jgi:biopolymer transport protein ExbB
MTKSSIVMKFTSPCLISAIALMTGVAFGQSEPAPAKIQQVQSEAKQQLEESLVELANLREQIAAEKIPLNRRLNDLETELLKGRAEYQQASRMLDSRTLDLSKLQSEIKSRHEEGNYISNLLSEYIRNFESRLHIAELQRYREALTAARLAPENSNLTSHEIYQTQAALLITSLDRIDNLLNGSRFAGAAVDAGGQIRAGTFVVIGPAAMFHASDGSVTGSAEQRLGSLEPAIIEFPNVNDRQSAAAFVTSSTGVFPLDPTLGRAHKIEATRDTLWQHIKKGGPVMVPIFVLAGAAFLVVLYKWLSLSLVRKPSKKKVRDLLSAVGQHNKEAAAMIARTIRGPAARMLAAGVEHLGEPRELIEEVMYERVLATRLSVHRFLPFVAICAAAAPLLGLLGTVTGIMNTFKLITVFGTGDVKTLSSGISEALITTEFGLIVAIPSLLVHAFLSRKARGIIDRMERTAVKFINQAMSFPLKNADLPAETTAAVHQGPRQHAASTLQAEVHPPTAQQVKDILFDLLAPIASERLRKDPGSIANDRNSADNGEKLHEKDKERELSGA